MYASNLNCSEETYTFIPSDAPVSLALSDANRAVSAANDLLGPVHLNSITNMVNNALVHAEVKATLRQGVKLDASRPEYHRVKYNQPRWESGIVCKVHRCAAIVAIDEYA
jgi:hypothetical protein